MVKNDFHNFHIWNEHYWVKAEKTVWKKYTFQQWSPEWSFIVKPNMN